MILSSKEIQELLNIIDKNQVIALGRELGPDFLTLADKDLLEQSGVKWKNLYSEAIDSIYTQFHFGMLSEALGQTFADNFTYEQLKEYISKGQYIPLTVREEVAISTIKMQKFNDLKRLNGKIFSDVNQVLVNNSIKNQQALIREQIAEGVANKQMVTEISHRIAELTGDWSRDFERIVAFNNHLAIEEGKAAMMERNTGGEDPLVYKTPFQDACESCVSLYLTAGVGSQPKLFKLSELRANGINIGRKKKEWKAVIGPIHPYCRCSLHTLLPGWIWDQKKGQFIAPSDYKYKSKRKPIRAWVAGQEVQI
jgi:hypothetical protein